MFTAVHSEGSCGSMMYIHVYMYMYNIISFLPFSEDIQKVLKELQLLSTSLLEMTTQS